MIAVNYCMKQILAYLKSDPRLIDIDYKESYHQEVPFYRSKVKLKKGIVTLSIDEIDPNKVCGKYYRPKDWNALISDHGTVLIDTRNEY